MDPIWNCVLAVCCPPFSQGQREALAKFLIGKGIDANVAEQCASVVIESFDLAPSGTLQPLKDAIATLARGEHYKG